MKWILLFVLLFALTLNAVVEAGIFFRRRCNVQPMQPTCAAAAVLPAAAAPACPEGNCPANFQPVGQGVNFGIKVAPEVQEQPCPDGKCPLKKPTPAVPSPAPLNLPDDADKPHLSIVGNAAELDRGRELVKRFELGKVFHVTTLSPSHWQAKEQGMTEGVYILAADMEGSGGKVLAFTEPAAAGLDALEQNGERLKKDGLRLFDKDKATPIRDLLSPKKLAWEAAKPYAFGTIGALSWIAAVAAIVFRRS